MRELLEMAFSLVTRGSAVHLFSLSWSSVLFFIYFLSTVISNDRSSESSGLRWFYFCSCNTDRSSEVWEARRKRREVLGRRRLGVISWRGKPIVKVRGELTHTFRTWLSRTWLLWWRKNRESGPEWWRRQNNMATDQLRLRQIKVQHCGKKAWPYQYSRDENIVAIVNFYYSVRAMFYNSVYII